MLMPRMVYGYIALMTTMYRFEPEILSTLISAGADVNARNRFGETALSIAIKNNNAEAIRMLR